MLKETNCSLNKINNTSFRNILFFGRITFNFSTEFQAW